MDERKLKNYQAFDHTLLSSMTGPVCLVSSEWSGWGLGLSVDERGRERERQRETFKHIFNHQKKNNQSFLVVVGVFLHYSLRNVLGLISFRDKKSHRTSSFIGH